MLSKTPQNKDINSRLILNFRYIALGLIILGSLFWILTRQPIAQDQLYHKFADSRIFFGIQNFQDIISNFPFLAVGISGLLLLFTRAEFERDRAWVVLFIGIGLVSIGSGYYHWSPSNETLVWDRLPMTIGFMGLFAALLGEYVNQRLSYILLLPLVIIGLISVFFWYTTDDLRLYYWVQLVPLITIPAVMILYKSGYTHKWLLLTGLVFYLMAKVTELYDIQIFHITHEVMSGHTMKHLLASAGCYSILLMLKHRTPGDRGIT